MARKRMIDPEFWSDEEIGQWSFQARLLYIGLWNFADDEGRFKAHKKLLKSQIFPYDDTISMEKLKKEISSKIQWYEINACQYGYIRNFLKYQRIDRPTSSKLPPEPLLDEGSTNNQEQVEAKLSKDKLSKEKIREVNTYVAFEQATVTLWNSFQSKNPLLSKVEKISDGRRTHLKKRFSSEHYRQNIAKSIEAIPKYKFLLGENKSGWKVSFDWLISNDFNYLKILEGRYGDKEEMSTLQPVNPTCSLCKGTGFMWVQSKGANRICDCRKKKQEI